MLGRRGFGVGFDDQTDGHRCALDDVGEIVERPVQHLGGLATGQAVGRLGEADGQTQAARHGS